MQGKGNSLRKAGLGAATAVLAVLVLAGGAYAAFPGNNGKIAFDTPLAGGAGFDPREVVTINPDGSGLAPLNPAPVSDREPAWSPNGQRVVYSCRGGAEDEICVINADGTGQAVLTDQTAAPPNAANDDSEPAF